MHDGIAGNIRWAKSPKNIFVDDIGGEIINQFDPERKFYLALIEWKDFISFF